MIQEKMCACARLILSKSKHNWVGEKPGSIYVTFRHQLDAGIQKDLRKMYIFHDIVENQREYGVTLPNSIDDDKQWGP